MKPAPAPTAAPIGPPTAVPAAAPPMAPAMPAGASPSSVVGIGPLVSPEGFLVAWGIVYLVISILAAFSEPLASSMAISVLVGDILANGVAVAKGTTQLREAKTTQPAGKGKVK